MSERPVVESAGHPDDGAVRAARVPPLWVVLLLTAVVFGIGAAWKVGCSSPYEQLCYNDILPLYVGRGLFDGIILLLEPFEGRYLEYPVLTGAIMQVAGWVVGSGGDYGARGRAYVVATAVLLLPFALATTAAMWHTVPGTHLRRAGRRLADDLRDAGPKASLMVALSPILLLDGMINWDLLPVAFVALAVWAWSRDATLLTGLFLGLGGAAKLYPLFLLGPLLVICARDRRWLDAVRVTTMAVGAWLAVNLPVMVMSPQGWREFYEFSQRRGIDFGSIWLAWANLGNDFIAPSLANMYSAALFLAACLGVAVLGYFCRSATFAQLAFLVVAAFALVNKVYSPQYALWLLPLAALARPRWPAFTLWQLGEVVYFVAIWRYLLGYGGSGEAPAGSIGDVPYAWAILLHVALTLGYAALIVVDVVRDRAYSQTTMSARVVA